MIWLIFQVEGCYFWLRKNTAVLRRFYRLIRIRSHSFMSHTYLSKRDIYLSKETYIRQEMSTETYTHQKETYIHQKRPLHDVIHTHSVSFIHVTHIFTKKRRIPIKGDLCSSGDVNKDQYSSKRGLYSSKETFK